MQGVNPWIEVDGGVTPKNAYKVELFENQYLPSGTRQSESELIHLNILWQVIEAGANALVAGSAVFGAKDYAEGMVVYSNTKSFLRLLNVKSMRGS